MNASVGLTSIADLCESIRHARDVELDAYVLQNPLLLYSLESAARSGAHVDVRLGDPGYGDERAKNEAAMRRLSSAGAQVTAEPGFGPHATHAKIAVVDDSVYLDDRNFTAEESETIVVEHGDLPETSARPKREVLAAESAFIGKSAGDDILFSTESLGPGPVLDALIARAEHGDRVRAIYDPESGYDHSAQALAQLRAAHVDVRASNQNHKIAVVGASAWIGSANASPGADEQREWGMAVGEPVASRLRFMLEYCWSAAKAPGDAAHSSLHGNPGA